MRPRLLEFGRFRYRSGFITRRSAENTRRIVLDQSRPLDTVARNPVPFSTHFTTREGLRRHVQYGCIRSVSG